MKFRDAAELEQAVGGYLGIQIKPAADNNPGYPKPQNTDAGSASPKGGANSGGGSPPIRQIELGISPFMIAHSLRLVISQCLVKTICSHCDEEVPIPSRERLKEMGIDPTWLGAAKFLKVVRGCRHCYWTGSEGRKALFEALIVDNEVKAILRGQPNPEKLQARMLETGETTLF